ncbi:MAG TPA: hypothetical protein VFE45_08400, partial [Coriobacteriia bacterium]|nr:hypothetical protein [Coriobacteriia bacterium]
MDVELLAITKINDAIARCPRLRANIAHNDKTPFTDGHIDIYARPDTQAKEDFRGRVPVQVKGRKGLPKQDVRPTFSITRSDLRGHLRDRGILYFVVYVDPASEQRDAYYVTLSPFKIDELLREAPRKNKSIPVPLEPLPSESARLEALLAFAYQSRSEDVEMKASEALFENIREITVHTASELDIDKPVTLKHSERDFSVVITGTDGTRLPADGTFMFTPAEYVGVRTSHVIRGGGCEFRGPLRKRVDEQTIELEISPGLRLRLRDPMAGEGGSVKLKLQDNLSARFADVAFFLSCVDDHEFELDGRRVGFTFASLDDCDDLRAHYSYLTKLTELFARLAVDVSLINLADITDAQSHQLVGLHAALVEEQE